MLSVHRKYFYPKDARLPTEACSFGAKAIRKSPLPTRFVNLANVVNYSLVGEKSALA